MLKLKFNYIKNSTFFSYKSYQKIWKVIAKEHFSVPETIKIVFAAIIVGGWTVKCLMETT